MGAAIALRDVVGKRQDIFVVAVIPPHRDLDPDIIFFTGDENRFWHDRGFRTVEVFHEFLHAAFIKQFCTQRFGRAFVR